MFRSFIGTVAGLGVSAYAYNKYKNSHSDTNRFERREDWVVKDDQDGLVLNYDSIVKSINSFIHRVEDEVDKMVAEPNDNKTVQLAPSVTMNGNKAIFRGIPATASVTVTETPITKNVEIESFYKSKNCGFWHCPTTRTQTQTAVAKSTVLDFAPEVKVTYRK